MSSQENYASSIHDKFGQYRPVWYPTQQVRVGDILELDDSGTFNRVDNLANYAPTSAFVANVLTNPASVPIDFVSTAGVQLDTKASGATNSQFPAVPQANAAISVAFSDEDDFMMYADAATETVLGNILALQALLLNIHAANQWQNNYIVATKVLSTPLFSLLLSQTSNSSIQLSLNGTLSPTIPELGQAGVSYSLVQSRGAITRILGATNVTPLVGGMRLVPHFPSGERYLEYV
ncbi:MAG: hypothetical protein LV479_08730 [Methylacidiphilales bacterium]|nr:hypothetical protein [Candidatus Methylacidiphilales bacterium]